MEKQIFHLVNPSVRQNAARAIMNAPDDLSAERLRGVSFDSRRGKYRARITNHGSEVWLGYYDSPELAHDAYVEAKIRLHEGYVG